MKTYNRGFIPLLPAILIGIGALGVATVATAQIALPGSLLYGLKTATENIRLAIALTDESKAKTHLSIAATKIDEIQQLHANNASADALAKVEVQFQQSQTKAQEEILHSGKGAALDSVVKHLESNAVKNQEVLSEIKQTVPTVAQPHIENAIDHSEQNTKTNQGNQPNSVHGAGAQ